MEKIDIEQRESTPVTISLQLLVTELPFEHIDAMDQKRVVEEDIAVVKSMLENTKPNVLVLLEAREEALMILDMARHGHERGGGTNDA